MAGGGAQCVSTTIVSRQSIHLPYRTFPVRCSSRAVHHTSFETWHLSTGAGSYLVKRLWGLEDPVWRPHIERAISLEAAALASGLPVACPVEPLDAGAR